MAIKYFDTLKYVQEAKKIKDPEKLIEYQAEQMESAIEAAVQYVQNNIRKSRKKLTTKQDLLELELKIHREIAELRYATIRYIVVTGVGGIITLGGMIAHGFHWI